MTKAIINIRCLISIIAALVATTFSATVCLGEVNYPTRPVEALCQFEPGGTADSIMRILADIVTPKLGQRMVVINKPGAGGMVALGILANSKPDGYAICQSSLIKLGYYLEKLNFKEEDVVPIIQWGQYPHFIWAGANSPWKTMKDVVEYARKKPGKLRVGHTGKGSTLYLALYGLTKQQNIKISEIPFKGDMPMLAAMLAGDLDIGSGGFPGYAERNDIRVLMTCGNTRLEGAPNAPTYREAFGIDPVVSLPAACMFVPKGTPNEIIKKLHDAFKEAIQEKKFKEFIVKVGITTEYRSTEEIQRFAVGERQKVQNVLREIGMIQ